MADKAQRKAKRDAKLAAKKQERQTQISLAVMPFLMPEERVLCAPAPGSFYPWAARLVRNRIVGGIVETVSAPLHLIAQGDGLPASFVVTDSRVIVLAWRLRRLTSFSFADIDAVIKDRSTRSQYANYGSMKFEVVEVRLVWRDQQRFRIWFKEPWLSEGEAIGGAILRRHAAVQAGRRDDEEDSSLS